jgi:hypothetical protein
VGDEKCIGSKILQSGNLKGRYYLGDLGIDGKIILKCIVNQDRKEWRGLVTTTMKGCEYVD